MNSVLVEAWYSFKMLAGNIVRDSFAKAKLLPLSLPNFTRNTQACASSVQVSFRVKAEEIKNISLHIVAPIKLHVTRTDDPMVVLQAKDTQQSLRNIILQAAAYDDVRKITVVPNQDMKK